MSDPPHDDLFGSVGPIGGHSGDLEPQESSADDLEFIEITEDRYALGNLLGEGGMGRVVVAEDRVLRRQVALKALAFHTRSEVARRRLAREAWITARLDHPGIVAVHDAGRLPDGTPFYTMRLVRGRSLDDALQAAPDLEARLALVRPLLAACEAVAYAHQAGIVHRDLKPANILLGGFGETQVVDWGLARPLDEAEGDWDLELHGDASRTRVGAVVGTPAFMAPEQARGEPADRRSDVFALGATLFVLLTGRALRGDADSDAALERAREGGVPDPLALQPDAPPELAAIARRALQPEADARYPDAAELAADLANWFEGRRVNAYTYSPAELARRLLQAWRTPIAATLLVLVVIGLSAVTTTLRVAEERDRALEAEREARRAEQHARDARARSDINLARALVQQARAALQDDERAQAEALAAGALRLADSPEARGVLAAFSFAPRPRRLSSVAAPPCQRATLSGDGRELLCLEEGAASLWEVGAPAPRWRLEQELVTGHAGGPGTPVVLSERVTGGGRYWILSRDGELLAHTEPHGVLSVGAVGRTRFAVHNTALLGAWGLDGALITEAPGCADSLAIVGLRPGDEAVMRLCTSGLLLVGDDPTSPDVEIQTPFFARREPSAALLLGEPEVLVVATHRGELATVDLQTGAVLHSTESALGLVRVLRPSPDGRRVAVVGVRGGARVWEPSSGNWVAAIPGVGLTDVAWESDEVLVTLGAEVGRWSVPAQAPPTLVSLGAGVSGLDVSPDGRAFAAALGGGELRVVSLSGDAPVTWHLGHDGVAKAAAFSPDGRWLASTSRVSPNLMVVDRARGEAMVPRDGEAFRRLFFASSGPLMAVSYGSAIRPLGPPGFTRGAPDIRLPAMCLDVGATPDGRWAAVIDEIGVVHLLDGEALTLRELFRAPEVMAVDVHPDGQRLALATAEGLRVTTLDGETLLSLEVPGADHRDVAFSHDGALLASGGVDGLARVWSVPDGELLAVLAGHTSRVSAVQFSPTEQVLVTGSWDETARIWDLRGLDDSAEALAQDITWSWGLELEDVLAR